MNDTQTIAPAASNASPRELDFFDIAIAMAKHKKLIIGMPLAFALAAGLGSMALPTTYKASAKILPPQQAQSGAAALLSQLGGVAGAAAGAAVGIKNPNDLYVGMLKSRRISDKLIKQYDLTKAYDTDSLETTRSILAARTLVTAGKDGFISIDFEDEDKQRVAKLTNSYVAELLDLTKVLAVTEAAQRRMFFEGQLVEAKNNLAKAEMTLKGSLDSGGVISVDSDSRAVVETVARLRAQIAAKEIQLGSMQAFVTVNNNDYKRAQEELGSLRMEYAKLQNGNSSAAAPPAMDGKRQAGLENIKVLREVKYNQMLYELLATQYEAARLDEARDSSIIQVLDNAVEPERPSGPKRLFIVLIAAALGLIGATAWAILCAARDNAQLPERALRWQKLKLHLRSK